MCNVLTEWGWGNSGGCMEGWKEKCKSKKFLGKKYNFTWRFMYSVFPRKEYKEIKAAIVTFCPLSSGNINGSTWLNQI